MTITNQMTNEDEQNIETAISMLMNTIYLIQEDNFTPHQFFSAFIKVSVWVITHQVTSLENIEVVTNLLKECSTEFYKEQHPS